MYFIVAITYASGLGYLFGVGKLKGRGRVTGGDIVRLTTSIVLPILAIGAQSRARLAVVGDHRCWCRSSSRTAASTTCSPTTAPRTARVRWGARLIAECGLLLGAWLVPSTTLSRSFVFAAPASAPSASSSPSFRSAATTWKTSRAPSPRVRESSRRIVVSDTNTIDAPVHAW